MERNPSFSRQLYVLLACWNSRQSTSYLPRLRKNIGPSYCRKWDLWRRVEIKWNISPQYSAHANGREVFVRLLKRSGGEAGKKLQRFPLTGARRKKKKKIFSPSVLRTTPAEKLFGQSRKRRFCGRTSLEDTKLQVILIITPKFFGCRGNVIAGGLLGGALHEVGVIYRSPISQRSKKSLYFGLRKGQLFESSFVKTTYGSIGPYRTGTPKPLSGDPKHHGTASFLQIIN